MNDKQWELLAMAAVALAQVYAMDPDRFPVFAWAWDFIARLTGIVADLLARISVKARLNYYVAVNEYGT